nr:hypothetical protein [Saprospiraceae bacterium]
PKTADEKFANPPAIRPSRPLRGSVIWRSPGSPSCGTIPSLTWRSPGPPPTFSRSFAHRPFHLL